jgi:hypothetical protein
MKTEQEVGEAFIFHYGTKGMKWGTVKGNKTGRRGQRKHTGSVPAKVAARVIVGPAEMRGIGASPTSSVGMRAIRTRAKLGRMALVTTVLALPVLRLGARTAAVMIKGA